MKTTPIQSQPSRLSGFVLKITRCLVLGLLAASHRPHAAPGPALTAPPPLSPALRAELGTIGVVTAHTGVGFTFDEPSGKAGYASEGAAGAVRETIESGMIPLAPIAAVIGAVKESRKRISPHELDKSAQDLAHAMDAVDVHAKLRNYFMDVVRQRVYSPFVVREVESRNSGEPANDRLLAGQGVSSILELAVEKVRLQRTGERSALY
ncbi:MAG: hypothetical protein HY735_29730 [Verrucomicrobia bacterium]|nr:hypothetical protein [Verrucomicrobiota bacterium]